MVDDNEHGTDGVDDPVINAFTEAVAAAPPDDDADSEVTPPDGDDDDVDASFDTVDVTDKIMLAADKAAKRAEEVAAHKGTAPTPQMGGTVAEPEKALTFDEQVLMFNKVKEDITNNVTVGHDVRHHLEAIAKITDGVKREQLMKMLSKKAGIGVAAIREEIGRAHV